MNLKTGIKFIKTSTLQLLVIMSVKNYKQLLKKQCVQVVMFFYLD